MGAWGIHTFENDGAMDWLGDFIDSPTEEFISQTFSPLPTTIKPSLVGRLTGQKTKEVIADPEDESVLGAAEVVAALLGQPASNLPEDLKTLPNITISAELSLTAVKASKAILNDSNLKDCWEDSDDYDEWVSLVNELIQRIEQKK